MRTAFKTVMAGLLLWISAAQADGVAMKIKIEGMTCPSCAASVEKHMKKLEEVRAVRISLKDGQAVVTPKAGMQLSPEKIRQVVKEAGYRVQSIQQNR